MSVLTEIQPIPTSLKGESQMSMCVLLKWYAQMHTSIVWLWVVSVIAFLISSVLIETKHQLSHWQIEAVYSAPESVLPY